MKCLLYNIVTLLVITLTVAGCEKEPIANTQEDTHESTIVITPKNVEFTSKGGSSSVKIYSNENWSIQTTNCPSWIKSIVPTNGNSKQTTTVTITVEENTQTTSSSHILFVKYGTKNESLVIERSGIPIDTYEDGEYVKYSESNKAKPIVLIFTGDGYTKEDHQAGGAFDRDMNDAIEAFLDIEPYKSYREYFTIYKIAAYSNERGVTNTSAGVTKDTKFKMTWKGGKSTHLSSPDNGKAVLEWCKKIPGINDNSLKKSAIGVIINEDAYAGTCHYWSSGKNISMIACKKNVASNKMTNFGNSVRHEMGGHGFGLLGDEYVDYQSTIPDDEIESLKKWQGYGRNPNISLYSKIEDSPWSHFKGLQGYEHVGMFEGAKNYAYGVWRPEKNSCMIDNRPYYNSPSRFAIVRRILEIAGELTPVDEDDTPAVKASKLQAALERFLAKDIEKTENATKASASFIGWDGVPYDFIPLAPPVLIEE